MSTSKEEKVFFSPQQSSIFIMTAINKKRLEEGKSIVKLQIGING